MNYYKLQNKKFIILKAYARTIDANTVKKLLEKTEYCESSTMCDDNGKHPDHKSNKVDKKKDKSP